MSSSSGFGILFFTSFIRFHLPGRSGIVLPLTPPTGHRNAEWEKIGQTFLEKIRELIFQDAFHFGDAVCKGLSAYADLAFNLSVTVS